LNRTGFKTAIAADGIIYIPGLSLLSCAGGKGEQHDYPEKNA